MSKIQPHHKEKPSYIYLRQSTMGQVLHHQESTERQYALHEKALALGWTEENIRILDGDLGVSGSQVHNRSDFQILVADVSMNKVGVVMALEASRLSRSSNDWNRLVEICALTDTLIIDEDGIYDPKEFNDQLLLGLKGTMSQAELHFIRARLQGGKLNKARKGELKFPLPVGYVHDDENRIVFDPDEQVRHVIELVFSSFHETGSAYGVVQKFGQHNIKFPKRSYGGIWDGKLIWGHLTYSRVLNILKNPSYAGAYVYGRYKSKKKVSHDGKIFSKLKKCPMEDWEVLIKEHHVGYISWADFIKNIKKLQENLTVHEENILQGPAREGCALLHGLLICGICGRRITIRYKGNGGKYPTYECNGMKKEGVSRNYCISFRCDLVDRFISEKAIELLTADNINIALKTIEELEKRDNELDKQWQLKIQRADYQAQLAQRRYEQVDPTNRLVAATLEKNWNNALSELGQVKKEYNEYQQKNKIVFTSAQKQQIFNLVQDIPKLWDLPSTKSKDKKRILRQIIKDITVNKIKEEKKLKIQLRWQGGAYNVFYIDLPSNIYDRYRYDEKVIERIKRLATKHTDIQIANILNAEGLKSAKGKLFSKSIINWVRYAYDIGSFQLMKKNEYTVKEVAQKFNVSHHVVYYWVERGYVTSRKLSNGTRLWITIDEEREKELLNRIQQK